MRTLLERQSAGLSVLLGWESLTEHVLLVCECNGEIAIADVPPSKVMDAFEHPSCYLTPEQLPMLNPKASDVDDD